MPDYSTVYEEHQLLAVCLDFTRLASIRLSIVRLCQYHVAQYSSWGRARRERHRLIIWNFLFLDSFGLLI